MRYYSNKSQYYFDIKVHIDAFSISISEYTSYIYAYGNGDTIASIKRIVKTDVNGSNVFFYKTSINSDINIPGADFVWSMACSPIRPIAISVASFGNYTKAYFIDTILNRIIGEARGFEESLNYFSPDGKKLYSCKEDTISVYDGMDFSLRKTILSPEKSVNIMTFLPNGKKAYIAASDGGHVYTFDPINDEYGSAVDNVVLMDNYMAATHDSMKLYLPEIASIEVFETIKETKTKTIAGGGLYCGIATSPDHPYAFAITEVEGTYLEIINTLSDEIINTMHIENGAMDVKVDKYAVGYIANIDSQSVTVVNNALL
ncbi:YncE family protein [Brucella intermedia]|uniref:YncE family protein n=1 Tax=Brucella intermedia TaxID=94625 RepID=UPI00124DA593|nr:hypothetical protein [Brucella intermedia]KAB2732360.1 hypothetical protein F9L02_06125 [Brucella intermedia]